GWQFPYREWLRQLGAVSNPKKRLAIAKKIESEAYERRGAPFNGSQARTSPDLVRLESRAGDSHWARWTERLAERWPTHDFKGRRRPDYPTNLRAVSRVNAVLNYAFSIIEAAARLACIRVGLHPDVGFL